MKNTIHMSSSLLITEPFYMVDRGVIFLLDDDFVRKISKTQVVKLGDMSIIDMDPNDEVQPLNRGLRWSKHAPISIGDPIKFEAIEAGEFYIRNAGIKDVEYMKIDDDTSLNMNILLSTRHQLGRDEYYRIIEPASIHFDVV